MKKVAIRLAGAIVGLYLAAEFVQGIEVSGIYTAIIVAILLGVLNLLVRPVLVLLTLPITILTLGLFLFVVNATIFWFVGTFVDGFTVDGFVPALLGSLVVSVASWIANKLS